jgi:hypothetical protein
MSDIETRPFRHVVTRADEQTFARAALRAGILPPQAHF